MMIDPQLTNLIVSANETTNIEEGLSRLLAESGSLYCMLLDRSGQIIAFQGEANRQDIMTLGALLAGSFASSREVAKLLIERDFKETVQLGTRTNIFTSQIGDGQWILVILFDKQVNLGLIKVLSKRTSSEMQAILERVKVESRARDSLINNQFRDSFVDTIDLLFKD